MTRDDQGKVLIGKVTGAVGLRGEVKIFHFADDSNVLKTFNSLIIGEKHYAVEAIRYKKKTPIIKLANIDDRNVAESIMDEDIYAEKDELPSLPEGRYYIKDLINLQVVDVSSGNKVGTVKNVIPGSAQDIYEIETNDSRSLLLPAVSEFVLAIDLDTGTMNVKLPDGIEDTLY
jgi:16S rRNA processing protein RimM